MYSETLAIETDRLVLRAPVLEHFEGLARLLADPGVARSLSASGRPRNRFEAWQSFAGQVGHWQLRGFGMFNVFERGTGEFVGRIGPWHPEGWPGLEVGWSLLSAYWGRGYATEAASVAVAIRCGERRIGETEVPHIEGLIVDVYGLTREEWEERRGR
jgi:RimJ/RimL family protein N-acetyltransferase